MLAHAHTGSDIVPVIMAGIIGIYGLVVSVLISDGLKQDGYALFTGFIQLGAGLAVGLAGLAAGFAIGIVGDAGVRGTAQQPRLFVGMILILIFAEVLGKSPLAVTDPSSFSCIGTLTLPYRSVRSHRCATHELESYVVYNVLKRGPGIANTFWQSRREDGRQAVFTTTARLYHAVVSYRAVALRLNHTLLVSAETRPHGAGIK